MSRQIANIKIENNHKDEIIAALKENAKAILTAWGETAERHAKEMCPVDTGRLRNSITYEVKSDEGAVYIGTNVEYGQYVELGTSRMSPKPFLKPAIVDYKEEYKQIMDETIK